MQADVAITPGAALPRTMRPTWIIRRDDYKA
jgi:hypothetical protein